MDLIADVAGEHYNLCHLAVTVPGFNDDGSLVARHPNPCAVDVAGGDAVGVVIVSCHDVSPVGWGYSSLLINK